MTEKDKRRVPHRTTPVSGSKRRASEEPKRRSNNSRKNDVKARIPKPRPTSPPTRMGNPLRRLRFGLGVVLLLFVVLVGRLVQLQFTDGSAYAAAAFEQRISQVALVAPRGAIVDRNGKPLAHSVAASMVSADPKFVKNPALSAKKLAPLLGVQPSKLSKKLGRKKDDKGNDIRFVYLARGINLEVGQAIQELELAGVYVFGEQRRDVPGHDLAANLVGFTGIDGDGLTGLEASFDEVLKGEDGQREFEVGASGQAIPDGYRKDKPAQPGSALELTIDSDLQFETQKIVTDRFTNSHVKVGAAVVLDVQTGEILSMASFPTYDAANPGTADPAAFQDIATSLVFEPGSIHKAVTFSAGIQEGIITGDSVLTVPPTIDKGGETFEDTHGHGLVGMTVPGMLAQSSNVGTIMIADGVGADHLYDYQRAYGLGKSCKTGLPGESEGIVQPPSNWSGPSYGGIPIGLGVAATPLQMTAIYAAIANDGVRINPTLVKGTRDADGDFQPRKKAKDAKKRVISAENAQALRQAFEAVPTHWGTAPKAAVPGYRVAGKTGTGHRVIDNDYAPGEVSSFIGMVPADAPRFAIGVFAHMPGSGDSTVAQSFSDIASFTLRHFGVAPTGSESPPFEVYA